jgi:hypothetical protein
MTYSCEDINELTLRADLAEQPYSRQHFHLVFCDVMDSPHLLVLS